MSRLHRGQIMKGQRRSPATAIALVALFFSLGGTGLAGSPRPYTITVPGIAQSLTPGAMTSAQVRCPPGTDLTGGGVESDAPIARVVDGGVPDVPKLEIRASRPSTPYRAAGWVVTAVNRSSHTQEIRAYAMCVALP